MGLRIGLEFLELYSELPRATMDNVTRVESRAMESHKLSYKAQTLVTVTRRVRHLSIIFFRSPVSVNAQKIVVKVP